MPLPLIPIISALAAGGTLVPHAAGGMIVTSAAAGYVAGTYLSTSAIAVLIAGATATAGAGLALAFGTMKGVISTVVARVATTAPIAPVVPTFLGGPVGILLTVFSALGIVYGINRIYMLKRKANHALEGKEAQFSETEANIVEQIIKRLAKKESPLDQA